MIVVCGCGLLCTPYLIIYVLTGFDARDSSSVQRGFTMAWLVIGQVYGLIFYICGVEQALASDDTCYMMLLTYTVVAIGGFVVVGQMMMAGEVCTVI